MGILDGLLGNASEISIQSITQEFGPILVNGETVYKAYKVIRDMFVFTNKRLILVDKQGITGTKAEYLSIPYKNIIRFSKESMGVLDLDAEMKIWLSGTQLPIVKRFSKDSNVNEIYKILGEQILS